MSSKIVTRETLDLVLPFFAQEIGAKILDGTTYGVCLENDTDKIKKYLEINEVLKASGWVNGEILRVFKLCNGYVFDLNPAVAQRLAFQMINESFKEDTQDYQEALKESERQVREAYNKRKEVEFTRLQNKSIKVMRAGTSEMYVALYNRNTGSKIQFNASCDNKTLLLSYDAYAIRHYDLAEANLNYLCPKGLRISKVEPCEVLPTRTGVKFRVVLEFVDGIVAEAFRNKHRLKETRG